MTSTIKVDNIQNQCGANIINESSNTITIGASGDTVTLASGASQSGFGREGSVNWQTSSIKTSTFTAVSGEGYFVNSGSALTMNLPAGSAGAIVAVSDYARNFATYNLTVSPNGSEKMGGIQGDAILDIDGQAATFVYVDSTKGWINVQNAEDTEDGSAFISATVSGSCNTLATCGDFKIATFKGPGTFCVASGGGAKAVVSYLVVAGGGAGGNNLAGGGGAGGFREGKEPTAGPYTASPLATTGLQMSPGAFPITIGGGGSVPTCDNAVGGNGSNTVFSTITSAGGGGGGGGSGAGGNASDGGSGGGTTGYSTNPGGCGNTPPVSPPQGQDGGRGGGGAPNYPGGGGGGAGSAGQYVGSANGPGGQGGNGVQTNIDGNNYYWSGGGGGGSYSQPGGENGGAGGLGGGGGGGTCTPGSGGAGGGSAINSGSAGTAGPPSGPVVGGAAGANSGGGGGGSGHAGGPYANGARGGAGGSGIVVIRYKFQ